MRRAATGLAAQLAGEIADLRRARGFSQAHVALEIGTSPGRVCEYESGRSSMNVRTLEKLCAVLGVTFELRPCDAATEAA